jgi:hypothetical protein
VLDRDQLLDLSQGREADPLDRSIDVQVSRLRQRLGDDPRSPQLIKTVRGEGYVLAPRRCKRTAADGVQQDSTASAHGPTAPAPARCTRAAAHAVRPPAAGAGHGAGGAVAQRRHQRGRTRRLLSGSFGMQPAQRIADVVQLLDGLGGAERQRPAWRCSSAPPLVLSLQRCPSVAEGGAPAAGTRRCSRPACKCAAGRHGPCACSRARLCRRRQRMGRPAA